MKTHFLALLACVVSSSVFAADIQQLPSELYQEIIANADTLADSAAVFSKLSQTSKQMKQQLEKALPGIVEQLAQKYSTSQLLVAFYLDNDYAKKLGSRTKDLNSSLFKDLITIEKNPKAFQLVGQRLRQAGISLCSTKNLKEIEQEDDAFLTRVFEQINELKGKQLLSIAAYYDPDGFTEGDIFYGANMADWDGALSRGLRKRSNQNYVFWLSAEDQTTGNYLGLLVEMDKGSLQFNEDTIRSFRFDFSRNSWNVCNFFELDNNQGYAVILQDYTNANSFRVIRIPSNPQEYPVIMDLVPLKRTYIFDWGL